jgi:hypothetical protein
MNIARRPSAGSASGRHATRSRRERTAPPAAAPPQPRWLAPFAELRQALTVTMFKILSCQRATKAEYTTLRGRMRAFRNLDLAYGRLMAASDQLSRATAALRAMIGAAVAEPQYAGAAAREIGLATQEIGVLTARLAEMSLVLDSVSAMVEDCRQIIGKPGAVPDWLCSRYPADPRERILLLLDLLRRRRNRCCAIEDVPRRISRGRAPPFDRTCSL